VGTNSFGQLFSTPIQGQVYAQPLLSQGTLFVATESNDVYGLDPDSGAIRWTRNLGVGWKGTDLGCGDLTPTIGITGTPVIDRATNVAYLFSKTYASASAGPAAYYAHAINVATGVEQPGFPVLIEGTASNDAAQVFDATHEMQRVGLLLMDGVVYAGFGSHCDAGPWYGWIVAVSTTGQIRTLWTTEAGSNKSFGAGIWGSGGGLVSDGPGQILFATGNGGPPIGPRAGNNPPTTLGESVVRVALQMDGTLKASDFFAPYDGTMLDAFDTDLGSGSPMGLPSPYFGTSTVPNLLVEVGKQGYVYLLNRDNLGGVGNGLGGGDLVVNRVGPYGGVWSKPAVWPGDGGYIYIPTASAGGTTGATSGRFQAYRYGLDGMGNPALSLAATSGDAFGFSSSPPVVTSDGTRSGSALVWIIWAPNGSGAGAQLRAYDAVPAGGTFTLRFSAAIGQSAKYTPPGIGIGRIYVGTRDGHVLGFGAPATLPLSGSEADFGTVTIGQTGTQNVTLTASGPVTVTDLTSSSTDFAVGVSAPPLPATLDAGNTLVVPVSFTPVSSGTKAATLAVTTSAGTTAITLFGRGQSPNAELNASPPAVSFGGTTVGGKLSGSVVFSNFGGAPLTIDSILLPMAPFGTTGLPAQGATLGSDESVTIGVTFSPSALGTYADSIALMTSAGARSVALTGNCAPPGHLSISSLDVPVGTVALGASRIGAFTLVNDGGTSITITKSKPPARGTFVASTSLAEGTVITPGSSLTETIVFTPPSAGTFSDGWIVTADDGTGQQQVTFTGSGEPGISSFSGSGWQLNGSALVDGSTLVLTPASTVGAVGSAFHVMSLASDALDVSFDFTIDGGTGADGFALVLADPSTTPATSIGNGGGGLGYGGLRGVAVAFDTYKNAVNPSDNFAGVADGTQGTNDQLHWIATSTIVPPLRNQKHQARVRTSGGTLFLDLDGMPMLSVPVTLPPLVLVGFTGANGGLTDRHAVSNVSIAVDSVTPIDAGADGPLVDGGIEASSRDGGTPVDGTTDVSHDAGAEAGADAELGASDAPADAMSEATGDTTAPPDDASGCSCRIATNSTSSSQKALEGLAALGFVAALRSRRRR
jgi:MYXO-CTERM domain-containing protein